LKKVVYKVGDKVKAKPTETRKEFCNLNGKVIDFIFVGEKQFVRVQHNKTYTDIGAWRLEKKNDKRRRNTKT